MDYIEEALGEKVMRRPLQVKGKVPLFLIDAYEMEQAAIGQQPCLLLSPRGQLAPISVIKKHINRVQGAWPMPVVLEMPALSRQRRQTLIAEKIPFVVPGKQLFLPFMGALLQEKYGSEKAASVEKLKPSAQMLLFYFIYHKNAPLYLSQMAEKFGFSAMSISRAASQLLQSGLLSQHKDGVHKVLTSDLTQKELFENAQPFLLQPVRKRVFINKADLHNDYFLAGLSALGEKSMLNPPNTPVYGATKEPPNTAAHLIDSETQCELELWRYDPTLLSGENCADILSLALSLGSVRDERVEMEIEDMLEREWGNNGRWL
ncbi:MAG: MarR family transcriptional regulator [Oscillospiraceae bacterium]|nr:MarR family transcriptional regulator [Oscillospiraceae bacterium]